MPLSRPPETPVERRAKRLRRTYLALFACFLTGVMLLTAWVAHTLRVRGAPATVVPTRPPAGTLRIQVDFLLREATRQAVASENNRSAQYLQGVLQRWRQKMAPDFEVFFLAPDADARDGDSGPWMAFLPFTNQRRFVHDAALQVLAASDALEPALPENQDADATGTLAWYRVLPQGVLLSSSPTLPEYALIPAPVRRLNHLATYRSSEGFLPPLFQRRLPVGTARLLADRKVFELRWTFGEQLRVAFDPTTPTRMEELTAPWFNPVFAP